MFSMWRMVCAHSSSVYSVYCVHIFGWARNRAIGKRHSYYISVCAAIAIVIMHKQPVRWQLSAKRTTPAKHHRNRIGSSATSSCVLCCPFSCNESHTFRTVHTTQSAHNGIDASPLEHSAPSCPFSLRGHSVCHIQRAATILEKGFRPANDAEANATHTLYTIQYTCSLRRKYDAQPESNLIFTLVFRCRRRHSDSEQEASTILLTKQQRANTHSRTVQHRQKNQKKKNERTAGLINLEI